MKNWCYGVLWVCVCGGGGGILDRAGTASRALHLDVLDTYCAATLMWFSSSSSHLGHAESPQPCE
jgi:hypothetical protein